MRHPTQSTCVIGTVHVSLFATEGFCSGRNTCLGPILHRAPWKWHRKVRVPSTVSCLNRTYQIRENVKPARYLVESHGYVLHHHLFAQLSMDHPRSETLW
ncbi:hypothetical protein BDW66DRAFT_66317 [Aspergillus desertorum]